MSDFNDISYVGRLWCPELIPDIEKFLPIFALLWWPFWKWRPVENVRCRESIQVIIIYLHMKFRWNRTMLNVCGIVVAILKMATGRNYVGRLWCPKFIPDIEKFLAAAIFKMAAKIQHCPISSKFDMWVDNDVPNWFPIICIFSLHIASRGQLSKKMRILRQIYRTWYYSNCNCAHT
jgi:hypothetical protein